MRMPRLESASGGIGSAPGNAATPFTPSLSAPGPPILIATLGFVMPTPLVQGSQASPTVSPSPSACPGLATVGQLSQASPTPSPSPSAWPGFETVGQLSQASPTPSPSVSACPGFGTPRQMSQASSMPSPSPSPML